MRISNAFRSVFALFLCVLPALALNGAENSQLLKYTITAVPGNLQVNRMPGTNPPRSYKEVFTFTVTNTTRTDYSGQASSCKTFDVKVIPGNMPDQPVWVWSKGRVFCQHTTTVKIPAGKSWSKTVTWTFTTAEVADGKYQAIGTFVPENDSSATADFEITSVQ
jgi:Intracellular proteinase inhibitor